MLESAFWRFSEKLEECLRAKGKTLEDINYKPYDSKWNLNIDINELFSCIWYAKLHFGQLK